MSDDQIKFVRIKRLSDNLLKRYTWGSCCYIRIDFDHEWFANRIASFFPNAKIKFIEFPDGVLRKINAMKYSTCGYADDYHTDKIRVTLNSEEDNAQFKLLISSGVI